LDRKDKVVIFFDFLIKFGLGGMLFFIPISNALINSFFGFILLGFAGKKLLKPDFSSLKSWPNFFLLLFFVFMALSLFQSGKYIETSLIALLLKWGKYILIYLIVQDTITAKKDFIVLLCIFLLSAGLTVISGITQFYWGVEFLRGREIQMMKGGYRAIRSSLNHCNSFGAYLIIPFFLSLTLLKVQRSLKIKALFLFLTTVIVFCVFHTYSRGTWIGVLVGLILMFFISRNRLIIGTAFIFIAILFYFPWFRSIFFSIFQAGGNSNRFEYWQIATNMFKDSPFFGKGIGTFMARVSEYSPGIPIFYAHNCFLQILAETGIFSLISFLIFVCSVIYLGIKEYFAVKNFILLGVICGVVGFLTHSFFDAHFYSLPLAVLFWFWLGVISALSTKRSAEVWN
jgi:O-antigen ligase